LHSFVGLAAILLYFQNFFLGLVVYALPVFETPVRRLYKPNHVLFGIISLFFAMSAIVTGATELFAENGCGYSRIPLRITVRR
jgi:hypothetical protein